MQKAHPTTTEARRSMVLAPLRWVLIGGFGVLVVAGTITEGAMLLTLGGVARLLGDRVPSAASFDWDWEPGR